MIPYIENFYSPEEADALFAFIKTLPSVRPVNARNKSSHLRRLSYPGYSPPLSHRHVNHQAGYDTRGIIEDAPDEYKMCAAHLSTYAGKPVNYLSTIGYLMNDHMNFHQHAEDQKREDQTVYVLSLGAMHPVAIRSGATVGKKFIPDGENYFVLHPTHGSLYVLPDSFNRPGSGNEHQHAVLEGYDDSYGGLRISINCKHIPPGLSPEEMKKACSRPAGRSQSQDAGLLMHSGPQVRWGNKEQFPDAVYVGKANSRGKFKYESSPYGNVVKLNTMTTPTFDEYARELMLNPAFKAEAETMRGKDLLCPWCKPGEPDCHALVWLNIFNEYISTT
jgi:hypothetical protein